MCPFYFSPPSLSLSLPLWSASLVFYFFVFFSPFSFFLFFLQLGPDLFSNLLLAGGFMQHKYDDPTFRELLQNLLIRQQEFIKEQLKSSVNETTPTKSTVDHINNGKPLDSRNLIRNLSMLQQQQDRLIKSETADTVPTLDFINSDESAVILKIPSFKLLPGSSSSTSGKNGNSFQNHHKTTWI